MSNFTNNPLKNEQELHTPLTTECTGNGVADIPGDNVPCDPSNHQQEDLPLYPLVLISVAMILLAISARCSWLFLLNLGPQKRLHDQACVNASEDFDANEACENGPKREETKDEETMSDQGLADQTPINKDNDHKDSI